MYSFFGEVQQVRNTSTQVRHGLSVEITNNTRGSACRSPIINSRLGCSGDVLAIVFHLLGGIWNHTCVISHHTISNVHVRIYCTRKSTVPPCAKCISNFVFMNNELSLFAAEIRSRRLT